MAGAALATVVAAALASALACSPDASVVPGPVAAKPAPGPLAEGPPPPVGGLSMPTLSLDWSPPSAAAGDIDALFDGIWKSLLNCFVVALIVGSILVAGFLVLRAISNPSDTRSDEPV